MIMVTPENINGSTVAVAQSETPIADFLKAKGRKSADFSTDAIRVKLSPHTHPVFILSVRAVGKEVIIETNNSPVFESNAPKAIIDSVMQRLRYTIQ